MLQASVDRLELVADGPISLGLRYVLRALGEHSEVDASVSVEGWGLFGRLLAEATEALLAAGALRLYLEHLGLELQPSHPPARPPRPTVTSARRGVSTRLST